MNTVLIILACCLSAVLNWPAAGWAQVNEEKSAMTQEEQQMDEQASAPEGQRKVVQRFVEEFGVDETRIADLRAQHLGYGEIHHLLSLARQMPNGITDDNVNQILQMRQQQHMGWGNISKTLLNKKLGPAITDQPTATTPTQPQGVTRPGHSTGSSGPSGQGIDAPGAGTGGLQRSGKPSGSQGGAGGNGGWSASPSHGGAGGRSSSAPGRTR